MYGAWGNASAAKQAGSRGGKATSRPVGSIQPGRPGARKPKPKRAVVVPPRRSPDRVNTDKGRKAPPVAMPKATPHNRQRRGGIVFDQKSWDKLSKADKKKLAAMAPRPRTIGA